MRSGNWGAAASEVVAHVLDVLTKGGELLLHAC